MDVQDFLEDYLIHRSMRPPYLLTIPAVTEPRRLFLDELSPPTMDFPLSLAEVMDLCLGPTFSGAAGADSKDFLRMALAMKDCLGPQTPEQLAEWRALSAEEDYAQSVEHLMDATLGG